MSNLVVNQAGARTFCDLVIHCEIRELACRIASAVCEFFQLIIGAIADCLSLSGLGSLERHAIVTAAADEKADVHLQEALLPDLHTDALDASGRAEVVVPILVDEEADIDVASLIHPQSVDSKLIIDAVDEISIHQRADVLHRVAPLFGSQEGNFNRARIIRTIAAIPIDSRDDVLQHAALLFNPQIAEKHLIIEAVAAIPSGQTANILQRATPLFCPRTGDWERARIIKAIAAIPVDQRDDVFYHAAPLFSPYSSKSFLIAAIAETPACERADVCLRAVSLSKPEDANIFLYRLITVVAAIPVDQRDDFCFNIALLLSPQMINFDRGKIIEAGAAIPVEQRGDVFHYASLLFVKPVIAQLGSIDKEKLIQVLAAVPAGQRAERVQRVLSQIQLEQLQPDLSHFKIIRWLTKLLETSSHQSLPPLVEA